MSGFYIVLWRCTFFSLPKFKLETQPVKLDYFVRNDSMMISRSLQTNSFIKYNEKCVASNLLEKLLPHILNQPKLKLSYYSLNYYDLWLWAACGMAPRGCSRILISCQRSLEIREAVVNPSKSVLFDLSHSIFKRTAIEELQTKFPKTVTIVPSLPNLCGCAM